MTSGFWVGWCVRCWLAIIGATVVLGACTSQDDRGEAAIRAPSIVEIDVGPATTLSIAVGESTTSAPGGSTSVADPNTTAPPTPIVDTTAGTTPTSVRRVAPRPSVDVLAEIDLEVTELASFDFPTGGAFGPDDAFYVVGQLGPVWRVESAVLRLRAGADSELIEVGRDQLVLDLSDRTSVIEAASSERGVLGVAFHPIDQRMYINFTDTEGNNVVASWKVLNGVAVESSERLVLTVSQPGPGHNGGGLVFAPDGTLFVGVGDGGASNGDDARDLTNLLGTVVRILPRVDGPGYDIPDDNPFVDGVGPGGGEAAPEIWAFGFRNPWRLFFDEPTGDLWVGDVGNNTTEELNRVAADEPGRDYGWNAIEGTRPVRNRETFDPVAPTYEWGRDVGYASIGGLVYRADHLDGLDGAVVFGDLSGALMLLGSTGGETSSSDAVILNPGVPGLVSLHVSPDGYLLGLVIWGELVRFDVEG